MVIEYICIECGYTFTDVIVIPRCKCPKCNSETDHNEWDGLADG